YKYAASSKIIYRKDVTLPGKVFVTGGYGGSDVLVSTEIYDPTIGTWTDTGALNIGRYMHIATLLSNGMVLVVGSSTTTSANSTELYSPTTGLWTKTGDLNAGRFYYHTATLLQNGMVLVAGGIGGGVVIASTEFY
ncbi:MAG: kelch repeat-containing protein, partial [bacterium]